MSRISNVPYFAEPPNQYSQQYFSQLVKAFSLYTSQANNPGEGRNTFIVLTNVQSDNDVGLETGTVFEVDGFLKISRLNNPHVAGSSATGAVGSVTVVTP
jgi:hypothetical protein